MDEMHSSFLYYIIDQVLSDAPQYTRYMYFKIKAGKLKPNPAENDDRFQSEFHERRCLSSAISL